jgi:LemA protein
MTSSLVLWLVAAVLLFWSVGAYNRLMRLRADAKSAFDAVGAEIARQVDLVRSELGRPDATQPGPLDGEHSLPWGELHAAASQFAASLGAVGARPLDPERIDALAAAQKVLVTAWDRAERDDAHSFSGARLPETLLTRRAQISLQTHAATEQFNQAVARYNKAVRQFPAIILAWIFGFRPARPLPHAIGTARE